MIEKKPKLIDFYVRMLNFKLTTIGLKEFIHMCQSYIMYSNFYIYVNINVIFGIALVSRFNSYTTFLL